MQSRLLLCAKIFFAFPASENHIWHDGSFITRGKNKLGEISTLLLPFAQHDRAQGNDSGFISEFSHMRNI
jgi:hypothetical protein